MRRSVSLHESAAELAGKRVRLRPLRPDDYPAWSEVRVRCRDWLVKWEPRPADAPYASEDEATFVARCSIRDRERHLGSAYGFGLFIGDRFAGEVNLSSVQRGAFQSAYLGYWIDEAVAGNAYVPEACVVVFRLAFERLGLHHRFGCSVPCADGHGAQSNRSAEHDPV